MKSITLPISQSQVENDRLLSPKEAAERLGVKLPTIRRKILRREISFVKLSSRCVRIPLSEIVRLITNGTVPAREVAHA
jgi:excisionase family DNA binding protein